MNLNNASLAPLRHPIFRNIWLATVVSNFGGLIQTVGAGWMMTSISTPDMVALVQASTTLPLMLFSLLFGAVADSFDRRRVMMVAQAFMMAVSIALAVFAYAGWLTPWLLLLFTFLIGSGTALNNPSWQASVGDMVPRSDLPNAVLINSVGFNITRTVGPAIGGIIVAAAGAAAAFLVNAFSYIAMIFVLWRWKPDAKASTLPRETLGTAITAGLRYVAMSPSIEKVLVRAFTFGFSNIAVLALMPLVARDILGGGPVVYGVVLGAFGIGAIFGAFASPFVRERLTTEWILRCAFGGFAVCSAVAALSPYVALTCLAVFIGGACWVGGHSLLNVTVQFSTPRWVVGRALSLYQTAQFGGMATGSWVWGIVASNWGADVALLASAVVMLAGGALGLWISLPQLSSLNLDPANRWKEPNLALDLHPRSGPIMIMIEYVVKDEDVEAFMNAMTDRRRIRIRDGARHWTLLRDLEDPRIWIESYHAPTWVEYIRHNTRMTHADVTVSDRIRALHSGDGPPKVHRMIVRPTTWTAAGASAREVMDNH